MNKKIDNTAKHGEADAPRKPKFLGVIEGYINTDWCPARMFHPDDARFRIMSSQEIILELADYI